MAGDQVILGIIIGTLFAIVYSLRVLILLERRMARMDLNIETLTRRILREELLIEKEERKISQRLGLTKSARKASPKKKTTKKKAAKRAASKKSVKKATKKKATKKSARRSRR